MASSRSTSVLLRNAGFHVGCQRKRDLESLYRSRERNEGPHVKNFVGAILESLAENVGSQSLMLAAAQALGNNWY
jgi:hypothetical protein